jgi:hypothetical protein
MARASSRRRPDTIEPTTLTECARRYHAAALALSRTFGLPLTLEFVQTYHPAISSIYIESGKVGVRLPDRVTLPPLRDVVAGEAHASSLDHPAGAETNPLPPGASEMSSPVTILEPVTSVPGDAALPCRGQPISTLKPAPLAMLINKVQPLAEAQGGRWVLLLQALTQERAKRVAGIV